MVSQISVLGITFHLYGLIVAAAVLVVFYLAQKELQRADSRITDNVAAVFFLYVALGAVVGARLWHGITDFYLYREDLLALFFVWNGGLSIFGALLGASVAIVEARLLLFPKIPLKVLLDSFALSLPIGQSLGRWANFVNQELYGLPTQLPWKLFISPENRLLGYERETHFHPLFLYESLAMALLALFLWKQKTSKKIGSGWFTAVYLLCYGTFRFFLDFLRIGVPEFAFGLSMNQAVLAVTIFVGVLYLFWMPRRTINEKSTL